MRSIPPSFVRVIVPAVCVLGAAFALSGCGAVGKGTPTVQVTISATADCNNCGNGAASALKFRVFEVADTGAVRTLLNKGLPWSKHLESGGANILVRVTEDFISPGTSKTIPGARDPKATAIVVEGNFCKKVGASWYLIHPLAKKGPLKVVAGATGLTLAPGK